MTLTPAFILYNFSDRGLMHPKKSTYENGATRSELEDRYDLIPPAALKALARRLSLGAARHGERNWEAGDKKFEQATVNHLLKHIMRFMEGDQSDNHLDAIITNAAFLCHFRDKNKTEAAKGAPCE